MFRLSNNLIGILNAATLVLSIPIVWAGVWLSQRTTSECEQFLQKPLIVLGVFLMLVSVAGIIGACCRVSWLLWLYLLVMFLLILLLFVFTILAFLVTNQGAGQALNGRGYKEYRLADYSDWLQNRVNGSNWSKIRSCLVDSKVCSDFSVMYLGNSVQQFYAHHLTALQSGCCKPSDDCNFAYGGPTNWTPAAATYNNLDCNVWSNDPGTLCFDCQSCKAGLLDNIKSDWKKVAIINIVFLVFLVVVYSIG